MKNLIILGLVFAGCSGGHSHQNFTLEGKINGLDTGVIYLSYGGMTGKPVTDTCAIVHGAFRFADSLHEPQMAYLYEKGSSGRDNANATELFIEPGEMRIAVDQGKFGEAKVTGSAVDSEYETLQAGVKPIIQDEKPLEKVYDSANEAYIKAVREKADEKTLDSMKYRAAGLHDQFEPFRDRMEKVNFAFFANHPQSYVTASELIYYTGSLPLDTLEMYYNRLGTLVQESGMGKMLAAEIAKLKAGSPGSLAADFSKKDLHGREVSLADFRGKYVLLDFWASWCVPCRKSMPHVKDLYNKYKDKGFTVIAVSDDDGHEDAWQKAVAKDGTDCWPNVLRGYNPKLHYGTANPDDVSEKFGIHSLPTKILINPGGKIIGRYDKATDAEAADLDQTLAKLFAK